MVCASITIAPSLGCISAGRASPVDLGTSATNLVLICYPHREQRHEKCFFIKKKLVLVLCVSQKSSA